MITKMKKLALLVYHKEYAAFLEKLREVGVVHIKERESGSIENPEMEHKMAVAARYARIVKRLEACAPDVLEPVGDALSAAAIMDRVETLVADIEQHSAGCSCNLLCFKRMLCHHRSAVKCKNGICTSVYGNRIGYTVDKRIFFRQYFSYVAYFKPCHSPCLSAFLRHSR